MKILIACEFSGIVREAFKAKGHDAWSCDLEATEQPGQHIQGDVLEVLTEKWDLMIAHPSCTHLSVSGAKHFKKKVDVQKEAISFFMEFVNCKIPKYAIENPVGTMSTHYRKPDQIIQPYHFGDPFQKTTCLWLKGLPKLYHLSTGEFSDNRHLIDHGEMMICPSGKKIAKWYSLNKSAKIRSTTFPGISNAFASQWG